MPQFGQHLYFGFIDLTLEIDENTIELVDYKTQRAPIKQEEADSNVQAGMYLSVAKELWPDKDIIFTFDLTRYGTVSTRWSDEKIDTFKAFLKTKWEWINSIEEPKATIGPACKWCAFTEICPKAQKLVQMGACLPNTSQACLSRCQHAPACSDRKVLLQPGLSQ